MTQVDVCGWDDLAANPLLKVEVGGTALAIIRVDDSVYALADTCSHAEASLSEGEILDHQVECPRHGATFDVRTGKALTLPATRPVATYTATVRDRRVFVEWED